MNDVLQVPMSKELRENATSMAISQGYSSLQEMVRVFLRQTIERKIETRFVTTAHPVKLSAKAIKRYNKISDDIAKGKGISFTAHSVDELIERLNSL